MVYKIYGGQGSVYFEILLLSLIVDLIVIHKNYNASIPKDDS